ncbi:MAG: histidinol-phosphate transaminase [Pseudomonadota bacterium]
MSIHPTIQPKPGILDVEPYVGGASTVDGANRVFKLSSNENPFGPSPKAIEAYRTAGTNMELYPDSHRALHQTIADVHGLEADRIVLGCGSDEIIAMLIRAYAGVGDEVLYSQHGFLMFKLTSTTAGATPVAAPERNLTTDVDAMIAHLSERTRLVFVANPNNPTGTMIDLAEIERLADALPPQALLVLDGAYAEYIRREDTEGAINLVRTRDNVAMTRTFSKIYGLAALRLGWCYGPDHVIGVLNRFRGPFNVTQPALVAGDAAMRDQDYIEHCRITNEVWRDWLTKELTQMGFPVTPSHGNFLLIEAGEHAAALDAHFLSRGLIMRRVDEYGLPNHLRITVGTEEACKLTVEAARSFRPNG